MLPDRLLLVNLSAGLSLGLAADLNGEQTFLQRHIRVQHMKLCPVTMFIKDTPSLKLLVDFGVWFPRWLFWWIFSWIFLLGRKQAEKSTEKSTKKSTIFKGPF